MMSFLDEINIDEIAEKITKEIVEEFSTGVGCPSGLTGGIPSSCDQCGVFADKVGELQSRPDLTGKKKRKRKKKETVEA